MLFLDQGVWNASIRAWACGGLQTAAPASTFQLPLLHTVQTDWHSSGTVIITTSQLASPLTISMIAATIATTTAT